MIGEYVSKRRWFRAKTRTLTSATIDERFAVQIDGEEISVALVRCAYADSPEVDHYVLPIATARGAESAGIARERPHLVIGTAEGGSLLYDALGSERLVAALLKLFVQGARIEGEKGTLAFRALPGFVLEAKMNVAPRLTTTEQTNTSIVFGDSFILKVVRKLDEGTSAELEMGEFLTRNGYASAPAVLGVIELERGHGSAPATVGILHRFLPNDGDAWNAALAHLAGSTSPQTYRANAETLGKRVGEMHAVLSRGTNPAFDPTNLSREQRRGLGFAVLTQARSLGHHLHEGDAVRIAERVDAFVALEKDPVAMRVHGDLHLGQILVHGNDFLIIDFEGETSRSLEERKAKRSPMADVAGMLRSFDYAAAVAFRGKSPAEARGWYQATADAFLGAYRKTIDPVLPALEDGFSTCLDFYLLEKCLYEIDYEANNRPDWIAIPREALHDLLASASTLSGAT